MGEPFLFSMFLRTFSSPRANWNASCIMKWKWVLYGMHLMLSLIHPIIGIICKGTLILGKYSAPSEQIYHHLNLTTTHDISSLLSLFTASFVKFLAAFIGSLILRAISIASWLAITCYLHKENKEATFRGSTSIFYASTI